VRARLGTGEARELAGGAATALLLKVAGLGTGYAFAVAVTRSSGAEAWGAFSLCLTVLMLAALVGRLGVDTAMLRLVAAAREAGRARVTALVKTGLWLVVPGSLLAGAAVYAGAEVLAQGLFGNPRLAASFRLAALGVPPLALGYAGSQVLRALTRVGEYVFFDLVARFAVALPLFGVALLVVDGRRGAVLAFVAATWVTTAATLLRVRACVRALPGEASATAPPAPAESWRGLLAIGLPLLMASSTVFLKGWLDTAMLGIYRTEAEVGVYNVALKLATLASLPLLAINAVAAPRFARAHAAGDGAGLRRTVEYSGRMILLTSVPITALLVAAPGLWLGVFGPEAAGAGWALVVLSLGYLFSALSGSVGYLMQMTGRQVAFQNITLAGLVLQVAANALLIPRWGVNGAAVSTCVGVVAWNAACVLYLRARLGIWTLPFLPRGRGAHS
jgi:O-antigen/teichoic acid export membrane protein